MEPTVTDRVQDAYESEPAMLQRVLEQLSFVALAADHTRWRVRGAGDEAVQAGLKRVAICAREGSEAVAEALRVLEVPPDARPETIAHAVTNRYLRKGWVSPRESLERLRSYLDTVETWLTRNRDDLLQREHEEHTRNALDDAISSIDDAARLIHRIPVA